MPFGISQMQPDCQDWATVKQEADYTYTTIGCHKNKQDAIDQMVIVSMSEKIDPLGEIRRIDETRAEIDLSAPAYMSASAKRGLRLYEQGYAGDGLMPATVTSARAMAAGMISEPKWRKIGAWIARHIGDLDAVQGDEITAGLVAMLLWGGGSSKASARKAQAYAEMIVSRLDAQRAAAPKKDQIKGSDENPAGSAADKTGNIALTEQTEKALQNKADEHNKEMNDNDRPVWTRVRVSSLRAVYRRGAGAFSTSHRPNIGRAQWAMARVNAFLYLAKSGRPKNPNYVTDNDLLHAEHPKYSDGGAKRSKRVSIRQMSDIMQPVEPIDAEHDHAHMMLAADAAIEAALEILKEYENDANILQAYHLMCAANAALSDALDDLDMQQMPADDMPADDMPADDMAKPMPDTSGDKYMRSSEMRWCATGADERRVAYTTLEMRDAGDGHHLVGYAAIFDSPSEPMPFIEYVKRGAFSKTIKDGADVRLLIDHEGVPLARSKSGTLLLEEDDRGLKVTADLDPANPDAARVISAMRRGDLSQMSFAFRTIKDHWSDDRTVRELKEVQLFDVSVVTFPAYEQTVAELRSADQCVTISSTTAVSVRKAQIAVARRR